MNNLWDDVSSEEFRDIPDETQLDANKQPMKAPPVQVKNPMQVPPRPSNVPAEPVQSLQENLYDVSTTLEEILEEEDFSLVLNDANLRIEQGRLYQMIMNHDLFDGMDADPKAVKNVQSEIRKFARERMEIMLGMRQEQLAKHYSDYNAQLANPFNELEVEILKKIASKATNGATETEEANELATSLRQEPKRTTIKPLGGSTAVRRPTAAAKPLPSKALPLQRKKLNATVEQILAEEGVSREDIEENYQPIGKPFEALSEEEKVRRAKETAARIARRKTVKSPHALPMATPEQEAFMAASRADQFSQVPGMGTLLQHVKNMPIKS